MHLTIIKVNRLRLWD